MKMLFIRLYFFREPIARLIDAFSLQNFRVFSTKINGNVDKFQKNLNNIYKTTAVTR